MKLICIEMNYATHNKELPDSLIVTEPTIFMKPDTSVLRNGKPFYLRDFSDDMQYETEIVVRIDRLGKSISQKFAPRYYQEITVGVSMTAKDLHQRFKACGGPWEISKSFDNSAVIGDFVSLEEKDWNINSLSFHLDIDGKTVQEGNTADMRFQTDEIIEYVSRYMTLKMGDLIFTGTPCGTGNAKIGNHLQAYVGDMKLLDFHIK